MDARSSLKVLNSHSSNLKSAIQNPKSLVGSTDVLAAGRRNIHYACRTETAVGKNWP